MARSKVEIPEVDPDNHITLYLEVEVQSMEEATDLKEHCENNHLLRKCVARFVDPVIDLLTD